MKLSARTLICSTALLCALTLSGCGSSDTNQTQNAPAQNEASASVSPGTITIASPNASANPSGSVAPGDINVVNGGNNNDKKKEDEKEHQNSEESPGSSDEPSDKGGTNGEKKAGGKRTEKGGSSSSSSSSSGTKKQQGSGSQGSSGRTSGSSSSSGGSGGSSGSTTQQEPAAQPAGGGSGGASSEESSGGTLVSRAQACTANQVSVSLTPGPSTAGSQQYTLSFTNVSAGPCRLKGNPDVAHTNTDGSSIMGISSQLDGNLMNPSGVVLQSGETTTAAMRRVSASSHGDNCVVQNSPKLTVWLPGSGKGYAFDFDQDTCTNVPQLFVGQFGA